MNIKGDLVSNWEYSKDSWHNYATATELSKKSGDIVIATLLSVMGKECHQIYKNLPLSTAERESKGSMSYVIRYHVSYNFIKNDNAASTELTCD